MTSCDACIIICGIYAFAIEDDAYVFILEHVGKRPSASEYDSSEKINVHNYQSTQQNIDQKINHYVFVK